MACLLAVCFGPVLFAWTLYKNSDQFQIQQKRAGELIQPLVLASHLQYEDTAGQAIPASTLRGKWWLVYTAPAQCDEACHQRVTELSQVHAALGKNVDKLGTIYLVDETFSQPAWLSQAFSATEVLRLPQAQRLHYYLAYAMPQAAHVGAVFLVDPDHRVMMHYSDLVEARGILSDVKRLLRVAGG
jgi:cytochrome oxidase Cu insertion factor (SCO1/SenC/PrrC family)